jgi:hypothetical protein
MSAAYWQSNPGGSATLPTHGNIHWINPGVTPYNTSYYLENQAQLTVREPGTFSNLAIKVTGNTTATATTTFKLRKNGSDGNQVVTIAPGLTGVFTDAVNTDSVVSGDLVALRLAATFEWFKDVDYGVTQHIFTPSNATLTTSRLVCDNAAAIPVIQSTDTDLYIALIAQLDGYETSNTNNRCCIPTACVARNALVKVYSNTADAAVTVTLQVNGVDTAVTVSVTAGVTGSFEDIVHSVAIAADDKVGWHIAATPITSGLLYITQYTIDLTSTNNTWVSGVGQQARTYLAGDYLFPIGGMNISTTQDASTCDSPVNGRALGICVHVSANSSIANSHVKWRTNAADGLNDVIITALTTGYFDDAQTDTFVIGDDINLKMTIGGNSVTITTIMWIGSLTPGITTGSIIVTKTTDPSGLDTEFDFTAGGGLSPSSFTLQDGENQNFIGITSGSGYSVSETAEPGYSTSYEVSNASPHTNIVVGANETVTVTVTNLLLAEAGSGIYKIVPDKRNDTLWVDAALETTQDVKIPDPFASMAYLGD